MSAENMTKFEVQKVLRDNILAGLSAMGIDAKNYTVMEAGQTPPTSKNDVILFRMETSGQLGWQAVKDRYIQVSPGSTAKRLVRSDEFIDHQEWLIVVLRHRRTSDTITTMGSEDVARCLISWFNGRGNAFFRERGMANTNIRENPVNLYKSTSDVYERSSSFRLKLQVPKAIQSAENWATANYAGNIPI